MSYSGFYPAIILSYSAEPRTAQVKIPGFTDGLEDGITATFAYPIGDDDLDTERQILANADVYIFFEQGEAHAPVIAFNRSHGEQAVIDVRRIRQTNIELLATENITMKAKAINLEADDITLKGRLSFVGDITHTGDQTTSGNIIAKTIKGLIDILVGNKSVKTHKHLNVRSGNEVSGEME